MVKLTKKERDRKIFPLDLFFANQKNCDLKTEKYIKDLLVISNTDLISSINLYELKLYPQAIYFLQQSLEKIAKSESLKDSTITLNSLKFKVGHQTNTLLPLSAAKIFGDIKNSPSHRDKKLNIEKGIKHFEDMARRDKKSGSILSKIYLDDYSVRSWIETLNSERGGYSSENILKEFFGRDIPIHFPYYLLPEIDSLSKILSPYNEVSRYPNEELDIIELDEDKEIIKNFYKIADALLRILVLIDPILVLKFIQEGSYNTKILKDLESCLGGDIVERVNALGILFDVLGNKTGIAKDKN